MPVNRVNTLGHLCVSAALVAMMLMPVTAVAQDYDSGITELKLTASGMPRGFANIPNQWFMMKSAIGWEEMMLIFGYADNRAICEHLVVISRNESPDRDFACLDAN